MVKPAAAIDLGIELCAVARIVAVGHFAAGCGRYSAKQGTSARGAERQQFSRIGGDSNPGAVGQLADLVGLAL
jgi:hypothetical protein